VQHLSGAWVDILGWAAVLAGLAIFVRIIVLMRRLRPRGANVAETGARLNRGREWEVVACRATHDLWRGPVLAELQADALVKIESAEHAYNRLVVECAKVCATSAVPTIEPAREVERQPEPVEHPPLAA
jgi:hypothetical protein